MRFVLSNQGTLTAGPAVKTVVLRVGGLRVDDGQTAVIHATMVAMKLATNRLKDIVAQSRRKAQ